MSEIVITRLIGKDTKVIIPKEVVDKYDLKVGDYLEWHVGEKLELTFGEMVKKKKGNSKVSGTTLH